MRNALALVPKGEQQLAAATIRTVFAQPTPELVREHWGKVADTFRGRYPRLAQLMDDSEEDVPAYTHFPHEHWRQIWSRGPSGDRWSGSTARSSAAPTSRASSRTTRR